MKVVHRPLKLQWSDGGLAPATAALLADILAGWESTPYADQQPARGPSGGVSCFGLVCAALDALYGRPCETIVGLPRDSGLHNPEAARRAMHWFLRRYKVERVAGTNMQPGDLLVIGFGSDDDTELKPGHVMLVGPRRNTLWHSTEDIGVHYTGLSLPQGMGHHSTYRCTDRDQWLHNSPTL